MLSNVLRDLRHGVRIAVARPLFAAAAIVTLAAGMAGSLVAFTAVNALFFKAFPMAGIEGAGSIRITGRDEPGEASFREFQAFSRDVPSLEVTAHMPWALALRGAEGTETVWALIVAPGYFEMMGLRPVAGRLLDSSIDDPAVVVSERFWRDRLGGTPLAGLTVNLSGLDVPVVGVVPDSPRGFGGFYDPAVWARTGDWEALRLPERLRDPRERPLAVLGRLKGSATRANADAELSAVAAELARAWPDTNAGRSASYRLFRDGDAEMEAVAVIASAAMALVGIVLAIAIFNLTGLLLARAVDRRHEIALRLALGAGRGQLVQQFVTESLVLGVPAGAAALALTIWSDDLLRGFALPAPMPLRLDVSPDATVVAFGVGLMLISSVAPGFLAAWNATVKSAGRTRLRSAVVTCQIAGATLFVAAAAMLVRSALVTAGQSVGFERDRALVVELDPSRHGAPDAARRFVDDVVRDLQALPGVRSVTVANRIPFYIGLRQRLEYSLGDAPCGAGDCPSAALYRIGPGHFTTMGIPLEGRDFDGTASDASLVIVSRRMAAQIAPSGDALGRRILLGREGRPVQVAGIAGDVIHRSFGERPDAHIYLPLDDEGHAAPLTIVARTEGNPEPLVRPVREAVSARDPAVIAGVRTMAQYLERRAWLPAAFARFFVACGLIALFLSTVGVVGAVSYSVVQRTREFGIRSAVGASPAAVRRLVLGGALRTAVPGVVFGLVPAVWLMRLTAAGFRGLDLDAPFIYVLAGVVQIAIVIAGAAVPARAAARVNPIAALRAE